LASEFPSLRLAVRRSWVSTLSLAKRHQTPSIGWGLWQPIPLSVQQFVDCDSSSKGCQGGEVETSFEFAAKNDLCIEESYTYNATNGPCLEQSCTVGLPQGAVLGYRSIPIDELALLDAVAAGPVSAGISISSSPAFQDYTSGILNASCGTNLGLDHAILIVGYIRMQRGINECGISWQASYPVIAGGPRLPPIPTPLPTDIHYQNVPNCLYDEHPQSPFFANGSFCGAKCNTTDPGGCPVGVLQNVTAQPSCACLKSESSHLRSSSSKDCGFGSFCYLSCNTTEQCDIAGGAKCVRSFCVYPYTELSVSV